MLKTLFMIAAAWLIYGGLNANAQSYRVRDLSERLARDADDLAERAYSGYSTDLMTTRSELDNMMLAQHFAAATNAFRRLVQSGKRDSDLRDAAQYLLDLARRFPSYDSNNLNWRDARRTTDDLARELNISGGIGGGGNNGGSNPPDTADVIGRVRWRGTVDDEVQLVVRGNTFDVRTISGTTNPPGTNNFTSPLPNRRVSVAVNKTKGRGSVRVLQQPTRDNDFTTVVQIKDGSGGARDYDLEIYWTR